MADEGRDEESRRESREAAATTTAAPETIVAAEVADATFEYYGTNPFEDPAREPLSTFAVDVDTGSYTLMRAWIEEG